MDAMAADILLAPAVEGLRFICASALRALCKTRTHARRPGHASRGDEGCHGSDAEGLVARQSINWNRASRYDRLIDPSLSIISCSEG